jgi:putative ABC transport system substrate-binding protein
LAQQPGKVWRIGILSPVSRDVAQSGDYYGSFLTGLREFGYVEARNVAFEWRFADGVYERLPGLAAELAKLNVDVIVTNGGPAVRAARGATTSIPIVAISVVDPVGGGLVASLSHPGGNITGLSTMNEDVYGKRLEMLSAVAPKATRIAVLANPNNPITQSVLAVLHAAAKQLNRRIQIVTATTTGEFTKSFSMMAREHSGALLVQQDSFLNAHLAQIADLAAKHKLPSIQSFRQYAEAGGLMSYGVVNAEMYRRAAAYVDKIFKGAKPGDIPVEQPTRLELVLNMRTAKALGIKVPNSILVQATKIIE